jgi:beta-RFAP synthase
MCHNRLPHGREAREGTLKLVRVTATARLHLGFLDLNGSLGRRFGSIGLAVDAFSTVVETRDGEASSTLGVERERAERYARRFAEILGLDAATMPTVTEAIPAHSGLGSGTQLALAVASALRRSAGLPLDPGGDARLLDRGARSGVGAALFERGGLVVDGGRGPGTDLPPVISHLPFPTEWRILLLLDRRLEGAHGEDERRAFEALPQFPAQSAAEICWRTMMEVLPGAAERDLRTFGDGVERIQELLGDHFAHAQGGGRFTSTAVGRVAQRLKAEGAYGTGQSSWGPTGFAFALDDEQANFLAQRAHECDEAVEVRTCKAARGAHVHEQDDR